MHSLAGRGEPKYAIFVRGVAHKMASTCRYGVDMNHLLVHVRCRPRRCAVMHIARVGHGRNALY